jgi:hemolysin D
VEAAKPIMVIVPVSGTLVAEVKVLNKDIGFVKVGQPVALKLDAFPFTRYGTVPGRIYSISSDSVQDDKIGLIYTAKITLNRVMTDRDGHQSSLTPGMSTTADIRTGLRSIISYLVSPIDETRLEAARER